MRRRLPAGLRRRLRHISNDGVATSAIPIVPAFQPGGELATIHHTREAVAGIFLRGDGIEIGALHQPLRMPAAARVKYVDRMPKRLRREGGPVAWLARHARSRLMGEVVGVTPRA